MKNVFAATFLTFLSLTLLTLVNLGCSLKGNGHPPLTATSGKPQETLFTVIETEDLEYPTLAASIQLPFSANSDNTVVLVEKHAYLTTERHLHVIDVSIPQRPVYLTALAFAEDIGKVLASGHHLVVATRKTFHLVDISQPSSPVLHSSSHLPHRHVLRDIAVHDGHLYGLGENDTLYVFSIVFGQARLLNALKLEKRWWLLSRKKEGLEVEQVLASTWNPIPSGIMDPLLSQRGFLELISGKGEKVRASSDFLVMESLRDPASELLKGQAAKHIDLRPDRGVETPIITTGFGPYYLKRAGLAYLAEKGETSLLRGQPVTQYAVSAGKMKQIATEQTRETLEIDRKRFLGVVTDFQVSGDRLYVTTAKGVFSVIHLVRIEDLPKGERDQLLSLTPLQANRPISLAIGQDYVCVLSVSGYPVR